MLQETSELPLRHGVRRQRHGRLGRLRVAGTLPLVELRNAMGMQEVEIGIVLRNWLATAEVLIGVRMGGTALTWYR